MSSMVPFSNLSREPKRVWYCMALLLLESKKGDLATEEGKIRRPTAKCNTAGRSDAISNTLPKETHSLLGSAFLCDLCGQRFISVDGVQRRVVRDRVAGNSCGVLKL